MKQYTFMRHGELSPTDDTKPMKDINFADLNAFKLSDFGRKHVHEVSQTLNPDEFDVILTATSRRTIETAKIVNLYLNKDIIYVPGINAWKADKYSDYISIDDYWMHYFQFAKRNGKSDSSVRWETFDELAKRTKTALEQYSSFSHPLIVAHSIIISLYTGIPTKTGVEYCGLYTTNKLSPHEPNFNSFLESD